LERLFWLSAMHPTNRGLIIPVFSPKCFSPHRVSFWHI
jgi:hypothetical protein